MDYDFCFKSEKKPGFDMFLQILQLLNKLLIRGCCDHLLNRPGFISPSVRINQESCFNNQISILPGR